MPHPEKARLRATMRTQRLRLSAHERATFSQAVCQRVLALGLPWRRVGVYLPFQGEVDTWPIIHTLWQRRILVLAPRCRPQCPGIMDWYAITSPNDLRPGSYGILEPTPDCGPRAHTLPDSVLVPGLAFDRTGGRLGYGGGYYDRFLASSPETCSIALAYDFQVVPMLPRDPWDVAVRILITPTQTITRTPCIL